MTLIPRKRRRGFSPITVDGTCYQYTVSLARQEVIVYSVPEDVKVVLAMHPLPPDSTPPGQSPSWRGKGGHAGWGKREVADLIRARSVRA